MFRVALVCTLLAVGTGGSRLPLARFQDDASCTNKIVNGLPAAKGEFPSQLSLQLHELHICGASILSKRWALTAAHCVTSHPVKRLSLLSGTHDFRYNGTVHPILQVVVHRDYDELTLIADIALLRVSKPFDLDGTIRKPITLPGINQATDAESTATVIGWGIVAWCLQRPNLLQKVNLTIMDHEECEKIVENFGPIYSSQICAYSLDGKGSCQGDSGGPLFVDGVIVGIVSYGPENCAEPGRPSIYTQVASFIDWINEITTCEN